MWPNPQKTADLVTFTGEILNGKLHFLCSVNTYHWIFIPVIMSHIIKLIISYIIALGDISYTYFGVNNPSKK